MNEYLFTVKCRFGALDDPDARLQALELAKRMNLGSVEAELKLQKLNKNGPPRGIQFELEGE